MKLITERDRIRDIIKSWDFKYIKGSTHLSKLKKLNPDTCSMDDVKRIIGEVSWMTIECGECGETVDTAIAFQSLDEFFTESLVICKDCLNKAQGIING
jgi:hypothetical protein